MRVFPPRMYVILTLTVIFRALFTFFSISYFYVVFVTFFSISYFYVVFVPFVLFIALNTSSTNDTPPSLQPVRRSPRLQITPSIVKQTKEPVTQSSKSNTNNLTTIMKSSRYIGLNNGNPFNQHIMSIIASYYVGLFSSNSPQEDAILMMYECMGNT